MPDLLYRILALNNKDKNSPFVDFAYPDRQTDTFKQSSLMKHEKVRPTATCFFNDIFHNEPQARYRFQSLCFPLNNVLGQRLSRLTRVEVQSKTQL